MQIIKIIKFPNEERYEVICTGTNFSLNSNRQNYFGERFKSLVSLPGITSKWCMDSCSRNEKQQSCQAEMRGRAQASSLCTCPEAGLSLYFYWIPLSKRLNKKILYIAVTKRLPCIAAESLREKKPTPKWDFWHTQNC